MSLLKTHIYCSLIPLLCFICRFCLCNSSKKTGTSLGHYLQMSKKAFVLETRPSAGSLKTISSDTCFVPFAVVWTEADSIKKKMTSISCSDGPLCYIIPHPMNGSL